MRELAVGTATVISACHRNCCMAAGIRVKHTKRTLLPAGLHSRVRHLTSALSNSFGLSLQCDLLLQDIQHLKCVASCSVVLVIKGIQAFIV